MTDGVRSKEGTAVYGIISATSRTGGAMAQFVAVPETQIAPLPVNTAPSAAASLPPAGLTAHQALEAGRVKAGDRLLFTAGAGGVESLGVQLAAARGAEVAAARRASTATRRASCGTRPPRAAARRAWT